MKQIQITRANNTVNFQTVSIDVTEFVFFTNLDPQEAHFPTLTTNQLGPAPSPNSSQCAIPTPGNWDPNDVPAPLPFTYQYGCRYHANEQGTVHVSVVLAGVNTQLQAATVNTAIATQQIVQGGFSPYQISGEMFQVVDGNGNVIQKGSGSIGPGLTLTASTGNQGIAVGGTPTVVGTYSFTFTVNDAAAHNLQQVQYSMVVSA